MGVRKWPVSIKHEDCMQARMHGCLLLCCKGPHHLNGQVEGNSQCEQQITGAK